MSETKCCGSCKHFENEGIDGFGFCVVFKCIHHCTGGGSCIAYQLKNNDWTEITPDNVDEIRENKRKIVIMNPREWDIPEMCYGIPKETLVLYSEWGGYYYYVLPELKIE